MKYHETLDRGSEIENRLNELGKISDTPGVPGIWRAILTDSDFRGKSLIRSWMEEAGLNVREDVFGNLIGRLEGEVPETIMVGSHVDTVKDGGKYDGACGVVTAIEAVGALVKNGWKPYYSVEVVGIEEEEGSRFDLSYPGSYALVGKLSPEELAICDEEGTALKDLMEERGYDWKNIAKADVRSYVKEFMELHVEQGAVLDREGLSIGLVENITGMVDFDVTVHGEQNHAGTTPMYLRKDPMVKTAELILKLTEAVKSISSTGVITFGEMQLHPGVANVIPGSVHFIVDMRDGNREALLKEESAVAEILSAASGDGFDVEFKMYNHEDPVPMDSVLVDDLERCVQEASIPYKRMNSGAGHDSMIIAWEIPTCMIFIPSVNGISHSPKEYTKPEDLGRGCEVLGRMLVKRASEK
ncbi:MAG: M20 family metallo-hydrolase [Firmicutes bacterium]|nr:M20 family metallo-hydrolase [Bacillota bacterium]